jgi:hypothetical protein
VWVEPGRSFAMNASSGASRTPRDHIAGVTGCDCTMCRGRESGRERSLGPVLVGETGPVPHAFCGGCGRLAPLESDGTRVAHHLGQKLCPGSLARP